MLFSTKHRQSLMDQAEEPDLYGFSLSFCLDTKERKNQVADYSSIHSTLETRPKQRSLRAASRCPYFNSLHFIRIIGDRKKKSNIFFFNRKTA